MQSTHPCMTAIFLGFFLPALTPSANAQMPSPGQQLSSARIDAQSLSLSFQDRQNLQKNLNHTVFTIKAEFPKQHPLAMNAIAYDGAGAAICPDEVADVIDEKQLQILPPQNNDNNPPQNNDNNPPPQNHSFFNRNLDKVSSPFASRTPQKPPLQSKKQFFITTADWLTGAQNYKILINGQNTDASLEFRDDAQNIAILSTPKQNHIQCANILPFHKDSPMPALVYLLLNPHSPYESLTQHTIAFAQANQYATANLTARNGYPIFTQDGKLAGLAVRPDNTQTRANIVHHGLIDSALHPQKYSRTKEENINPVNYTGHRQTFTDIPDFP